MRAILGLMLAVGLAGSASAQAVRAAGGYNEPQRPGERPPFVPDRVSDALGYEHHLALLKRRAERQTKKDGGQLTPKHLATLQRDLDALNKAYGMSDRPRRSTF